LIRLVDRYPILPFKNINNKREFLHIRNLVNYLEMIIAHRTGGILLLSEGNPISTSDLISMIARALSKDLRLVEMPVFLKSMLQWLLPGRINKLFGSLEITDSFRVDGKRVFMPVFTLEHGIEEMVEWYITNRRKDVTPGN